MLGKPAFRVVAKETDVDLIVMSVTDLGFPEGASLKDIYAKARALGLYLCPVEVGPQLRLQYHDQPQDEPLFIAMEPITASSGNLYVFHVERYGGDNLRLYGNNGYPDHFWGAYDRWVFLRYKE